MNLGILSSGSSGNALVAEHEGACIFLDNGLSGCEHGKRLQEAGFHGIQPLGLFLSHEHGDHSRGAGVLARRWKVPVFSTRGTYFGAGLHRQKLPGGVEAVSNGDTVELGPFSITLFSVSHDAADPSGFLIRAGGVSVGIATDMGEAGALVVQTLGGCNGLVLEFNHDLDMLWDGPYPWPLKQRISSGLGHLSNNDAAALLERLAGPELKVCVLAHLSQENNTPELAMASARRVTEDRFALLAGSRHTALPLIQVV